MFQCGNNWRRKEGRWWDWRKGREKFDGPSSSPHPSIPCSAESCPCKLLLSNSCVMWHPVHLPIRDAGEKVGWQEKMLGSSYACHCSGVCFWLPTLCCLSTLGSTSSSASSLCCVLQTSSKELTFRAPYSPVDGWLPLALSLVSKPPSLRLCCLTVLISSLPLLNLLHLTCCMSSTIFPGVRLKQGWKMEKDLTFLCPSIPTTYHWPAEQIYSINNHNSTKKDREN